MVNSSIKSEQAGHTVKLLRLHNNDQASGQRQEASSGLHGGLRTWSALQQYGIGSTTEQLPKKCYQVAF